MLPKNVIIQIGKPLFGNLLNIEFNYSNGFSFNPKIDGDYLDLLKNFDSNEYIYFFESCLKNLENNKRPFIIKKFNFELKCNHQNTGTILIHLIYGEEMIIKGILRRG